MFKIYYLEKYYVYYYISIIIIIYIINSNMSNEIIYDYCCVYRIHSLVNPEMVYFGSTNNFKRRMKDHKTQYRTYLYNKNNNKKYNYCTVYEIFDLGKYSCKIANEYENISKKQLRDFETTFIQNNMCVNIRQSMTDEMKKEKVKEYNEKNKLKLQEKINCTDCCGK